jgi:adenine-specific DNA-methyltransferase
VPLRLDLRYIGSKASVVDALYDVAIRKSGIGSMCDPFGGMGIVGSYFKARGFSVTTGDHLTAPYCFQTASIGLQRQLSFSKVRNALDLADVASLVHHLNGLQGIDGWLVREYSARRPCFTERNAKHIEACRKVIGRWNRRNLLTANEHRVLLASLINSMDRVANTAGTYYAFLKSWQRKALLPFEFRLLKPTPGRNKGKAVLADALTLVGEQAYDLLYLDPPYNTRRYSRYYHLPETIARSETPPSNGMSGVPQRERPSSAFNDPKKALIALEELLSVARFRLLMFHYSDDGIIKPKDVLSLLRSYGRTERHALDALGYSTTLHTRRTVPHILYSVMP